MSRIHAAHGLLTAFTLTLGACAHPPSPAAHGQAPSDSLPALPARQEASASGPVRPLPASDFTVYEHDAMYTGFSIQLPDSPRAKAAAEAVFARIDQLDATANEWKDGSPLAAVSRGAGGPPVNVPEDLFRLLKLGYELGNLTDGAFDITWAALWNLWDFKSPQARPPSAEAIAERLPRIDYRALELNQDAFTARLSRPGMVLGVGGIVKGFALDEAAKILRAQGFSHFLISAGGQYLLSGQKGDRPWRLGIRDPRGDMEDAFLILEPPAGSVSTSGDYERFFEVEGVRYHHILNPKTGMPGRGLRSVTLLSADGTRADALSTACMVKGPQDCARMVEKIPGISAFLVLENGQLQLLGPVPPYTLVHPPKP